MFCILATAHLRLFLVKNFVKPTAENSTFLNGRSFHPEHTFEGIIIGEAIRLRRLNETDAGYKNSIEKLRDKCIKSGFKSKIVYKMINKVKDYQNLLIKNHNDVIKTTVRNDEKKRKQNDVGYQF